MNYLFRNKKKYEKIPLNELSKLINGWIMKLKGLV